MHDRPERPQATFTPIDFSPTSVRRWVGWLYVMVLSVIAASLSLHYIRLHAYNGFPVYQLNHVFQLNRESSVPTWVSAVLLLMAAAAAGLVARQAWLDRWRYRWHWAGLSGILAIMSLDEVATFHEQLTEPFRDNFELDGILFYAWVVPVGLGLIVLGLVYLPFVLSLPWRTMGLCLGAAAMAIAGGLILEMFGGAYHAAGAMGSPGYMALMVAEETLELLAWVTVLWAMLDYPFAAAGTSERNASSRPVKRSVALPSAQT